MNALKSYRKDRGLTLDQMAIRIGVTKSAVWKYENDIPPSFETAIKISMATEGLVKVVDLRPELTSALDGEGRQEAS